MRVGRVRLQKICMNLVLLSLVIVALVELVIVLYPASPKLHSASITKSQRSNEPAVYLVTTTRRRPTQMAQLIQLAQTLLLVRDVHWLVVEECQHPNDLVHEYLLSTGLDFTYLLAPMPKGLEGWPESPRGVPGLRAALAWLRRNAKRGVVCFSDDSTIYDYRFFDEVRGTRGVAVFPVGVLTKEQRVSTPVVQEGRWAGWFGEDSTNHKFLTELAAFAINIQLLLKKPQANFAWTHNFQEESLVAELGIQHHQLELKAEDCTRIWVWRTRTEDPPPASRTILSPAYNNTNLRLLQQYLISLPSSSPSRLTATENINKETSDSEIKDRKC